VLDPVRVKREGSARLVRGVIPLDRLFSFSHGLCRPSCAYDTATASAGSARRFPIISDNSAATIPVRPAVMKVALSGSHRAGEERGGGGAELVADGTVAIQSRP